ncbi:MAG: hypothetical protein Q8P20_06935 [bacterium]|nr:hypothetical protein [bacterium]
MKKQLCLVSLVWLILASTSLAQSQDKVNNQIKVETYKIWVIQTRTLNTPVSRVPIWWDLIVILDHKTNIDAGWNPTWHFGDNFVSLWLMPGVQVDNDNGRIDSWKYDIFLVQKLGNLFLDQEWIYFHDTYKNWFRFYGYWKNIGLQTTGTTQHGRINITVGPRLKMDHGKNKFELYYGLMGISGQPYDKLQFGDWKNDSGSFWVRYSLKL